MKRHFAFVTTAYAEVFEGFTPKTAAPLRPRTAMMDAFVKRVNGSPQFAFGAAAAAVDEAMKKVKTKA